MRIVTFASESYFPGTRALIRSIIANAKLDRFEMLILTEGAISDEAKRSILEIKPDAQFIARESLGEFKLSEKIAIPKANFRAALQKLLIFKLPDDGMRLYLDSDMICVGSLREAERWNHFTAPIVFGITLPGSINDRPMFSAGIFAFEASSDLFDRLQAFALMLSTVNMPDQDILNRYFSEHDPDAVHYVGIEWEMIKRVFRHHPQIWQAVKEKRMIHFVGRKPWELQQEPQYRELNKLWERFAG